MDNKHKKVLPVHVAVARFGMLSDIYLKNVIERFCILSMDAMCSAHSTTGDTWMALCTS